MTPPTAVARRRRRLRAAIGKRTYGLRTLAAAFLRLEIVEELSYPMAFALSELGVVAPIIGYFFIGQLVGDSQVVGSDYFTFAVIGIAVTVILQSALSGFGTTLQRAQNRGQLEFFLTEPVPWLYLPVAMNIWQTALGVINGIVILVLGLFFGARFLSSGLLQFGLLIALGVVASTAIGILAASVLVLAKRSRPLLTLYGIVSSLLGGALFSVDQLPQWLRALSFLLPHTYVINGSRSVLMGDPGTFVISFDTAVAVLAIFDVTVFGLGLWLFSRSLQYARRAGILAGY